MSDKVRSIAARACAILCAATVAVGLAAPAMGDPGDDDSRRVWKRAVRPLSGWTIAIDPGHNGGNSSNLEAISQLVSDGRGEIKDCDTTGTQTNSGYAEHTFNFLVSQRLADRLGLLGAQVLLTREDNEGIGPCVDVRGRFAEDVDADLMISIHGNGTVDESASGFFAIVADPAISPSQGEPSLSLADDLLEALASSGLEPSSIITDGVMYRDDLATLNFARRPTVLLELGEMRNPEDAAFMQTVEGHQQYALAIAAGVQQWTSEREPGD